MSNLGTFIEGAATSFTLGLAPGTNRALIFDFGGLNIDFTGSAQVNADYTFRYNVLGSSVQGLLYFVPDNLVEGIETATITASGQLITIVPGATGRRYENILGDWIEGSLAESPVSLSRSFSINSSPVGQVEPLTYIGAGGTGTLRNLLDFFEDGPDETIRIRRPGTFDLGHAAGRIDENGAFELARVDPDGPDSFVVNFWVEDTGGAWTTGSQTVEISRLSLQQPPSAMILLEGETAPALRFTLSRPVDVPVTITAEVSPSGFGADLQLLTGVIPAGETSADLVLLRALRDDLLESVESGNIVLRATAAGHDVAINRQESVRLPVEIWDELRSATAPTAAQRGYDAAAKLSKALVDKFDVVLAAQSGADHAAAARTYAAGVAQVVSVTIDANSIASAYDSRMRAAEALEDRSARIDATYDARRLLYVDTGNAVAKTLFTSGVASFSGGLAAGLTGVSSAAALSFWPALAVVAVGWGALLLYEHFEDDIKRTFYEDFSQGLPRSGYRRLQDWWDQAPATNPNLGLLFGSGTEEPLLVTEAPEVVVLASATGRVSGTPSALDGDVLFGLGIGGRILVQGMSFGPEALRVTRGSAILGIDLDGNQSDDLVLRLEGDFEGVDFNVSEDAAGTLITAAETADAPREISGADGADTLTGGNGNDTIDGVAGDNRLDGGGGQDRILGGDGRDTIIGAAGDDIIFGGRTSADLRDVIYGGDGNDTAHGGAGNDELRGDAGNDLLSGDAGADTLIGGTGNDTLSGGSLGDMLMGGDGDDFLNGGFGFDRLNGGLGADVFFHLGVADHGSDWIQDYSAAQGDVLQVGIAGATRADFQINQALTPGAGAADVAEAFVIYRPTGQILFALVDGMGQDQINLRIGETVFDLLA